MLDPTATIRDFLAATAAARPTPGGGSAAALAGALAAALGEMVLNYSVNKTELAAHKPELESSAAAMTRARHLLLGLMVEDQQAYEAVSAARRGGPTPDFTVAQLACGQTPLTIAVAALDVLELADRIAEKVNQRLLSDLAICAELAMATVRSAIYTARVNLNDIPDGAQREAMEAVNKSYLSRAIIHIQSFSRRCS